jgi:tRNA (adenine37-N6)-methyltransferase
MRVIRWFALLVTMEISLSPIAHLRTPFREKFGVPRQSGLVPSAEGRVEFLPGFSAPEFVRGLEAFSHVWLITSFHCNPPWTGSAVVRPPRLGGNEKVGVFASRAPNRPNGLGLSLMRVVAIEPGVLRLAGVDCVDGTPVYDVKPYLPWCEAPPDARADWASSPPPLSDASAVIIAPEFAERLGAETTRIVQELLRLDVAPAYLEEADRTYGLAIAGWNIRWRIRQDAAKEIFDLKRL